LIAARNPARPLRFWIQINDFHGGYDVFARHSVVDYIVGILLILAPLLLGFADGTAAQWVPQVLGALVLLTRDQPLHNRLFAVVENEPAALTLY
jgi:hypothetical protein